MTNKASAVLKQIISLLGSLGSKARSRTNTAKARLIMFSLMKNKKVLMDSLSNKIQHLIGNHQHKENEEDLNKAIVLYNNAEPCSSVGSSQIVEKYYYNDADDNNNKYPDLRHSLFNEEFDEEDDQDLQGGSVIDLVRNSKQEGEDFKLEDEIDHAADLFINRFHKQMRMQKLLSFKRYQEMLQRSL